MSWHVTTSAAARWDETPDRLVWERADLSQQSIAPDDRASMGWTRWCIAPPTPAGGRSRSRSDDVRVNALGSMRVFEACARAQIPVVYLSSSAVYGDQPAGSDPGDGAAATPAPSTPPARSRASGSCDPGSRATGCSGQLCRLFATYGAGHRPGLDQGITNIMLTQLLAGDRIEVRGSLDRARDLLYVDDAAAAIELCLRGPLDARPDPERGHRRGDQHPRPDRRAVRCAGPRVRRPDDHRVRGHGRRSRPTAWRTSRRSAPGDGSRRWMWPPASGGWWRSARA